MAETPYTLEMDDLQKQIDTLTSAAEVRLAEQKTAAEQIKEQLQTVTGAAISTMGQIVQLEDVLADQRRERYQLEGMLRVLVLER